MAWDGYFQYAGQEFINVQRTAEYAHAAGAAWFKDCYGVQDLGPMLGERYRTPLLDPAPWTDPDVPNSYDFWGVYPLTVTGIEDSTRTAEIIESVLDGGRVGRVRHGTKSVVFSAALVGASDCAVEYGLRWLRRVLLGAACGTSVSEACAGEDLCYLICEPVLDWTSGTILDALDCLDPLVRSLRQVVFHTGPTVTSKAVMADGGAAWTISMTATAGTPWEFGLEFPIIEGFGVSTDPYVSPIKGVVNMNGPIVDDSSCAPVAYMPVYDPSCPALVPPPAPPGMPVQGCYVPPLNWKRRQFTIPEEYIPLWAEAVPQIRVHAAKAEVRNLRLRFYADVDGDGDITDDPCSYCGDIVISYVPLGQTLVMDGSDELVYVEAQGTGRRRADSLVFATDGSPFTWPVLSCGFGYIVTVDLEQSAPVPAVDFSLYPRAV